MPVTICAYGHRFQKSSACPICPICDLEQKPKDSFLSLVAAPARRALIREGISTLEHLSSYSEREILRLHGIGPASIPVLQKALSEIGLTFSR